MPARLLLQKVRLDLSDAQRQQVEARVRVAEAIGVPVGALKDVEVAYDLAALPRGPGPPDFQRSAAAGTAAPPGCAGRPCRLRCEESALQLEIAKQYPDIHLNTGYEYDQGLQKWGLLGFGVELPLLNRNEGPIAQAEARRRQAAARFEALQAKVIAELDRALAVYQVAAQSRAGAEALLATQRKQQESVEQQFKAGAADRLDVLTAQLELAASELALEDSQTQIAPGPRRAGGRRAAPARNLARSGARPGRPSQAGETVKRIIVLVIFVAAGFAGGVLWMKQRQAGHSPAAETPSRRSGIHRQGAWWT